MLAEDDYEYETFEEDFEFYLGEYKDEELRDLEITAGDILKRHEENNYHVNDIIGIDNPFEKPLLRKFIRVIDVNDEMIDIMYQQVQVQYDPYKFVIQQAPNLRGRILINK